MFGLGKGPQELGKPVNGGPSDEHKKIRIEMNKRCVESGLIKDPSVKKGVMEVAAELSQGVEEVVGV
jgi:hypothetical protein